MNRHYSRAAMIALGVGLALTILITLSVFASTTAIGEHIQTGYPHYSSGQISAAVNFYTVYLVVLGALGAIAWSFDLWLVRRRRAWAYPLAIIFFLVGTSFGLFNLLIRDTSGDTALPELISGMGLLPSVAGLIAIVLMWKHVNPGKQQTRSKV